MGKKDKFWSDRVSKGTTRKCPKCGSELRKSGGSWSSGFYFCRKCGYSKKILK